MIHHSRTSLLHILTYTEMALLHIYTPKNSDSFENAVRTGTFIMLEGIKWIAGQPWIDAALKTAGFEQAIIYWPGPVSPSVGIDFGDHDIATRAIRALNNAEVDGYILKARWHKDVGLLYTPVAHVCTLTQPCRRHQNTRDSCRCPALLRPLL